MRSRLNEMLAKRDELKDKIRDIDRGLADMVLSYEGSVEDALRDGLIRLNFQAPAGFYKFIHRK